MRQVTCKADASNTVCSLQGCLHTQLGTTHDNMGDEWEMNGARWWYIWLVAHMGQASTRLSALWANGAVRGAQLRMQGRRYTGGGQGQAVNTGRRMNQGNEWA